MHKDLTVVLQTVLGVPFFVYSSIKEIQFVQDNFIKYTLNLPKQCSNYISRSEVSKLPLKLKIWSQMVEYLYNLNRGTNNKILDNVSIYAARINTCWMQTLSRLLKTNGFAYVLFDTQNLNRDQLSKQFLQRCKDNYLKSLYYSNSNRIDNCLQSVSWILAEFYFNRGLQRLYTGTCIILQKTINGFLCLLIVFLKNKTYQLILKDVIKLNRNLR